jgi:hypothetical protein
MAKPRPSLTQDSTFIAWPQELTPENVRTLFQSGDINGTLRDTVNRLFDTNNVSHSAETPNKEVMS